MYIKKWVDLKVSWQDFIWLHTVLYLLSLSKSHLGVFFKLCLNHAGVQRTGVITNINEGQNRALVIVIIYSQQNLL